MQRDFVLQRSKAAGVLGAEIRQVQLESVEEAAVVFGDAGRVGVLLTDVGVRRRQIYDVHTAGQHGKKALVSALDIFGDHLHALKIRN